MSEAARDPDLLVRAAGVGKRYRMYASPWQRIAERLTGSHRHESLDALRDVSFELRRGEALGIIGQNGAGKSTLMKILAGVLQPTEGTVEVHGTLSSILELGAGFHPDFTGLQNARINAAMLGLGPAELERKLPEIADFCELGDFLHQPVKFYSTGMVMRLAFAIATQVDPDVLIVDEALSVGDGYFQKKCSDRLLQLIDGGTSLLFCSHAMYYVASLCSRAIWLRRGAVELYGAANEVITRYEEHLQLEGGGGEEEAAPVEPEAQSSVHDAGSDPRARLVSVELPTRDGRGMCRQGEPFEVLVTWEAAAEDLEFHVGVGVARTDGTEVFHLDTREPDGTPLSGKRRYRLRFVVHELPLVKGEFSLNVFLVDEKVLHVYDRMVLRGAFRASTAGYGLGLLHVPNTWTLLDEEEAASDARREVAS